MTNTGLQVIGSDNALSELLILDTDWLGTLDYPPLLLGFGPAIDGVPNASASAAPITMCGGPASSPGRLGITFSRRVDHDIMIPTAPRRAARSSGPPHRLRYPRNTAGVNNSVTRLTVGRFGNAGVVTSQLSNEVSYAHIYSGGSVLPRPATPCCTPCSSRTS